ncbi:hypothetical protein ALC62_13331 [Cyphomyrmex costatus]|uniref:Uncharacterized protein n=1 Tax=Cyphomyrmex costatus TaxID=456900 RepID=A0A151IA87_9HYME|nr:hypothetical protein ALC62_13331 [Cyphomyrmex costatus]
MDDWLEKFEKMKKQFTIGDDMFEMLYDFENKTSEDKRAIINMLHKFASFRKCKMEAEMKRCDNDSKELENIVEEENGSSLRLLETNMEESGSETPPSGQHDTISAVDTSNTCILTGSRDGLIQVWK